MLHFFPWGNSFCPEEVVTDRRGVLDLLFDDRFGLWKGFSQRKVLTIFLANH
jgi:hypothetical protein